MLYAICGPSQAGKTTILTNLLNRKSSLLRLVTFTTRVPRPGEIDGKDYYFVSKPIFQEMTEQNQMIYPILYRGEYYGIGKSTLLLACQKERFIGVLRPDGIPHIEKHVPVTGVYVEMDNEEKICKLEDKEIYINKNLCSYFIINTPGLISQAVDHILAIIEKGESNDH